MRQAGATVLGGDAGAEDAEAAHANEQLALELPPLEGRHHAGREFAAGEVAHRITHLALLGRELLLELQRIIPEEPGNRGTRHSTAS